MNSLQHGHIVRFITAFRRSHESYPSHYICFEWADGGNLADLWDDKPQPRLSASLIRAVVDQIRGLAHALRMTHYLLGSDGQYSNESYIHGDLKPKNILWFKEGGEIGTLKIADWGDAKVYGENTATRTNGDNTYGTRRYEPPEVETGTLIHGSGSTQDSRSRLYDLWSFGCFTLEFLIWLLHGRNGLTQFHQDKKGDYGISDSFYEIDPEKNAKVHGVVNHWMDSMEKDPLCFAGKSALGDLLDVVRHGLLVVKLPEGGGSIHAQVKTYPRFVDQDPELPTAMPLPIKVDLQPERFRAIELASNLCRIFQSNQSTEYWYRDVPRQPIPSTFRKQPQQLSSKIPGNYDGPGKDPEDWKFSLDNEFAATLFEKLADNHLMPKPSTISASLCQKCNESFGEDITSPFFSVTYSTPSLAMNASTSCCDLCVLLWQVCKDYNSTEHSTVQFQRQGSTIKISHRRLPVLSLFCDYGT